MLGVVPGWEVVSRGHTTFHKRGKGSGNFFYSSLFHCSVGGGTRVGSVFAYSGMFE